MSPAAGAQQTAKQLHGRRQRHEPRPYSRTHEEEQRSDQHRDFRRTRHTVNLASDLNFARFYLSEILEGDAEKVVYLDADTIVLADVAVLYDETLTAANDELFAAVSRKNKKICGAFLNCGVAGVDSLLRVHGITDPEEQLDAFNAGIMVIHLRRWKLAQWVPHPLVSNVSCW